MTTYNGLTAMDTKKTAAKINITPNNQPDNPSL